MGQEQSQQRRRRDRSFYLVMGKPRINYTGTGRGPLLFHVHVPEAEQPEVVDAADTVTSLAGLRSRNDVTLQAAGKGIATLSFGVCCETACRVRVHTAARFLFTPTDGVRLSAGEVIFEEVVPAAAEDKRMTSYESVRTETITEQLSRSPRDEDDEDTRRQSADRARLVGVPEHCALCIEVQYTDATGAADGGPLDCAAFYCWSLDPPTDDDAAAPQLVFLVTLLRRGTEVFKLDDIFDLGGDVANKADDANEADGDVAADEDEGDCCVVCLTEPKNTIVLPCRHLCLCAECAQMLRSQTNTCPMCRTAIDRLMTRAVPKKAEVKAESDGAPAT